MALSKSKGLLGLDGSQGLSSEATASKQDPLKHFFNSKAADIPPIGGLRA